MRRAVAAAAIGASLLTGLVAGAGVQAGFDLSGCTVSAFQFLFNGQTRVPTATDTPNGNPPLIVCNGTTYVPVRFFADVTGSQIGFQAGAEPGTGRITVTVPWQIPSSPPTPDGSSTGNGPSSGGASGGSTAPSCLPAWNDGTVSWSGCAGSISASGVLTVAGRIQNVSSSPIQLTELVVGVFAGQQSLGQQTFACSGSTCPFVTSTLVAGASTGFSVTYPNTPAGTDSYSLGATHQPITPPATSNTAPSSGGLPSVQLPPRPAGLTSGDVTLVKDLNDGDQDIIETPDGTKYLLDAQTYCLWCSLDEGDIVTMAVHWPTITLVSPLGDASDFWLNQVLN